MKNNFRIKIFITIIAFALFLGASIPAIAANQTITLKMDLKNEIEKDLISVKLAVSGTEKWGKELLTKPVKSGETTVIHIPVESGKSKFDIALVYNDSKAASQKYSSSNLKFKNLDLTGIKADTGGLIIFKYQLREAGFNALVYNHAEYPKISEIEGKPASTIMFNIKNESKDEIETLKLSPTGKDNWGENLLKAPLKVGESVIVPIAITADLTKWDLAGTSPQSAFGFTCKNLNFSRLTPATGGNIAIRFSNFTYSIEAIVSNNLPKTPYPKQSGNNIMLFDTDSDGALSADEVNEQVRAAKPDYKSGFEVRLSDKIDTIGNNAFERHQLKKITIPSTVKTIESDAFLNAGKLATVIFKEGLVTIEPRAFLKTALTSVTLPNSLTTISDSVFNGCDKLANVTLGKNVTSIGMGAFGGSIITDLKLPESLITIGFGAFSTCKSLKTINIPDSVKSVEKKCISKLHCIRKC